MDPHEHWHVDVSYINVAGTSLPQVTIPRDLIKILERVHDMTELQKTLHREGHHALVIDACRIAGEAFEI